MASFFNRCLVPPLHLANSLYFRHGKITYYNRKWWMFCPQVYRDAGLTWPYLRYQEETKQEKQENIDTLRETIKVASEAIPTYYSKMKEFSLRTATDCFFSSTIGINPQCVHFKNHPAYSFSQHIVDCFPSFLKVLENPDDMEFYHELKKHTYSSPNPAVFMRQLFDDIYITQHCMFWLLIHLATCSEKIKGNLFHFVSGVSFKEALEHPFVNAFLRESQRMSPPPFLFTFLPLIPLSFLVDGKRIDIGPEEAITVCFYPIQNDSRLILDAHDFNPERWIHKRNVEHEEEKLFLNDPLLFFPPFFSELPKTSQDTLEIKLKMLLIQLVKDWKISLDTPLSFTLKKRLSE